MNKPTAAPLPIVRTPDSEFLFLILNNHYAFNEEIIHDDSFGADMEISCSIATDRSGRSIRLGFHSGTLWTVGFFRKEAGESVCVANRSSSGWNVQQLLVAVAAFLDRDLIL